MEKYDRDGLLSNLRSYLESNGINTSRLFRCINPNHRDSNASMKYFDDGRCYCFGCGANYNLVDVIGIMENMDKKEAFKKALQYFGREFPKKEYIEKPKEQKVYSEKDYTKAFNYWSHNLKDNPEAMKYLKNRGLSDEVIKRFKLGYNNFDFKEFTFSAVVIPVNKHCFSARNINDNETLRYYKPKGCQVELFNKEALNKSYPYCVVTEGEFDCLSFETIGINAMALGSANNVNKFVEEDVDKTKTYILALDNDEVGGLATQSLIDYFNKEDINYCVFDNCGFKDANQALIEDKEAFEQDIKEIVNPLIEAEKSKHRKRKQEAEM